MLLFRNQPRVTKERKRRAFFRDYPSSLVSLFNCNNYPTHWTIMVLQSWVSVNLTKQVYHFFRLVNFWRSKNYRLTEQKKELEWNIFRHEIRDLKMRIKYLNLIFILIIYWYSAAVNNCQIFLEKMSKKIYEFINLKCRLSKIATIKVFVLSMNPNNA